MVQRILLAALILTALACSAPQQGDLIVSNVAVYTGENEEPFLATVAVKDGKFLAIDRDSAKEYRTDNFVDGRGLYITPGLWDMHAHVGSGQQSNIDISEFTKHGDSLAVVSPLIG